MRFTSNTFRPKLLAIAVATLLAGCGGGGGGDGDSRSSGGGSTGSQNQPTGQVVEGRAVKGTLKHAAVKVYEFSPSGDRGALLWEGETDDTGTFRADIGSYDGEYEIVVTAVAGKTQMICDVPAGCGSVAFGGDLSVSKAFEINALVKADHGSADVAVTPWTAMAAARARKLIDDGIALSEAVEKARSETSAILGFDISANPADLADGYLEADEKSRYAVANAALASILVQGDIGSNLKELVKSFEDGKFDEGDPIGIGEIKEHFEDVIQSDVVKKNFPGKQAELELIASALPEHTFDPEPSSPDGEASDIDQFKLFTKEVRTWVTQIEQTDFRSPLTALQVDADTVSALLSDTNAAMLQQILDAVGQIETYLHQHQREVGDAIQNTGTLLIPLNYEEWTETGPTSRKAGDLRVTFGEAGGNLTLSATAEQLMFGDNVPSLTIKSLTLSTPIPVSKIQNGTLEAFDLPAGEHEVVLSAELLNSLGHSITLTEAKSTAILSKSVTYPDLKSFYTKDISDAFKMSSLTANAEVSDGKGNLFKGRLATEAVHLSVESVNPANYSTISFSGSFTGTKGTFDAEVTLKLNNAEQYDWLGVLNNQSAHWVSLSVANTDLEAMDLVTLSKNALPVADNEVYREAWVYDEDRGGSYTVNLDRYTVENPDDVESARDCLKEKGVDYWRSSECYDLYSIQDDITTFEVSDATLFNWWDEQFQSSYTLTLNGQSYPPSGFFNRLESESLTNTSQASGWVAYDGLKETESSFADVTLNLKVKAKLPELPEATVYVSANRSRLDGGEAALRVNWGAGSYTALFDLDNVSTTEPSGRLTFYNANGLKLVLTSSDLEEDVIDVTGEAFVKGKKVGELSTSDGHYVLRYTDGTFETLY